jgi:16S rRNA (cytosine967-C5)-methyltransferase
LVHEITAGVIRQRGYLEWLVARYLRKEIADDLRYLLWVALYQLSFMRKGHYHVVNETVEFAKKRHGQGVANFVNGVLRRFMREKEGIAEEIAAGSVASAISFSFPEWLVQRWCSRFGDEKTSELLTVLNRAPEFGLRVDLRRISRDEAAEELKREGIMTRKGAYLESALCVSPLAPVFSTRLFKDRLIFVQDEVSQLAAGAVQPKGGDMILDACAGSGTKSQQIREMADGHLLISLDREKKRLGMAPRDLIRVAGDALQSPFGKEVFDTILVDAPCTSLGIIRKHPEIKWRRQEKEIALFGKGQRDLIMALWGTLRPGGYLVYSVCSFEPEETTGVVDSLRKEIDFVLENPLPLLFNKEYFLSLPHETGADGFFIARLKKI